METTKITVDSPWKVTLRRIIAYSVLILITLLALFPFVMLAVNASRNNAEIQRGFSLIPGKSLMNNLTKLLDNKNLPTITSIRNSLIISTSVAALSVYFSALTAFGIFAYDFKFKKAAFSFIMIIMMVPAQVSALGFVKLVFGMGLKDSMLPLIIPAIAAPSVFFFMKQYLESALPMEIVEATRIDGGHEFFIFNAIVLPIMKPAMAVQAIFTFVAAWNNYFMPALILYSDDKKTLPIIIAQLRNADYMKFDMGQVYILLAVAIIPLILVYLLLSKYIIRGVALGSVKG